MNRSERQRREAITLLIAVRQRNDDVARGLETERQRLLTQGNLIASPRWRRCGPFVPGKLFWGVARAVRRPGSKPAVW
jgi:hypothetical protein